MRYILPTSAVYVFAFVLYWVDNSAFSERPQTQLGFAEFGPVEKNVDLAQQSVEQPSESNHATDCDVSVDPWVCFLEPEGDLSMAEAILNKEASDWPADYRGKFLRTIGPDVLLSAKKNGLFPSVIFSQAILETGWGRSNLAKKSNNLFGIKAFGKFKKVQTTTFESVNGKRVPRKASFRVFENWGDSIAYHGRLLRKGRRYQKALHQAKNWSEYINLIAKSYASSPTYVKKISIIVRKYKLDRWDETLFVARP